MLSSLELTNFKCFKKLNIPIAPLTLLTGLNNTGKSTILQSLRMLHQYEKTNDPNLPGYGPIDEARNRNADLSEDIDIRVNDIEQKSFMMVIHVSIAAKHGNNDLSLPLMSYLSADRWGPRVFLPLYTKSDELSDVGPHGEYVLDFFERHSQDILPKELRHAASEGNTLEYNVRGWLHEISPEVRFSPQIYKEVDSARASFNGYRPLNVGFGLSYTLPVLVLLLGMTSNWLDTLDVNGSTANRKEKHGALVMIENPEAHLHPSGQAAMGRLIALVAACGVQVIVETHSDHLMDGIRIAVKDGVLPPNDAAFHYFAMQEHGQPTVDSPKLHANGKLDHWPEGFFDQAIRSMARLAKKD